MPSLAKERDRELGFRKRQGDSLSIKKSGCSVIRYLPCYTYKPYTFTSGYNSNYGQGPQFRFFQGEVRVSPEPKVAHHAEACFESLRCWTMKDLSIPLRLERCPWA